MKRVRIAELKSRLSEHLRAVRRGHSLTVLDRDTPIATIHPFAGEDEALIVRHPLPGTPRPGAVVVPPKLPLRVDVVDLLLEERQGER